MLHSNRSEPGHLADPLPDGLRLVRPGSPEVSSVVVAAQVLVRSGDLPYHLPASPLQSDEYAVEWELPDGSGGAGRP
jgi:hypothetical protein